jgi:hypothetical protein
MKKIKRKIVKKHYAGDMRSVYFIEAVDQHKL